MVLLDSKKQMFVLLYFTFLTSEVACTLAVPEKYGNAIILFELMKIKSETHYPQDVELIFEIII